MSLKINYNVSAIIANNSLKMNDNRLSASLERLSSGYKINHAKDNAAGLAIARRMNAQLRGLDVAAQDAKDGVSVIEIADGALSEVHDILQRMNELAVKSATGSITDQDREAIQAEVRQLKDEITRIGQTTEYNGQGLFDGTFDLKGYTKTTEIKVNYFSDPVNPGDYKVELSDIAFDADGRVSANTKATVTRTDVNPPVVTEVAVTGNEEQLILKGEDDYEIRLGLQDGWNYKKDADGNVIKDGAGNPEIATEVLVEMELTNMGPMTLQIGANEGQTIDLRIPQISLLNAGIKDTTVLTQEDSSRAIAEISDAIKFISSARSRLGAYQNRLEHTQTGLESSSENVTAAYSRIMDTDMAEEMTEYTNMQVVTQAATSMLAQANERPSQMLQLLQ